MFIAQTTEVFIALWTSAWFLNTELQHLVPFDLVCPWSFETFTHNTLQRPVFQQMLLSCSFRCDLRPEVGLLKIQVWLKYQNKVWQRSYLWHLNIWSYLKLKLSMSSCSTAQKLKLSSSFRCDQSRKWKRFDVGHTLFFLSQTSMFKILLSISTLYKSLLWIWSHFVNLVTLCEFGHTFPCF